MVDANRHRLHLRVLYELRHAIGIEGKVGGKIDAAVIPHFVKALEARVKRALPAA
jgi:hypothetical protein